MNRRKQIQIDASSLIDLFTVGEEFDAVRCVEGVPTGAQIVGVEFLPGRNLIVVTVEHPDFDLVLDDNVEVQPVMHERVST